MSGQWKEGLCGCFNDPASCLITCIAPCVQYGINQEQLDGESCVLQGLLYYIALQFGCCCLFHMGRRQALRSRYGLAEEGNDCLVTWCCAPCAICQGQLHNNYRLLHATPQQHTHISYSPSFLVCRGSRDQGARRRGSGQRDDGLNAIAVNASRSSFVDERDCRCRVRTPRIRP